MLVDAAGTSIGVVSMTTVNGDFVNDQLPTAEDPIPADLPPAEAWQYQPRVVSHGSEGAAGYLAPASRRAGDAWAEFERLAPSLTDEGQAELWAAITAPAAYPELQDWVARRGHGGAAPYSARAMATEIERLRGAGADIVVAQFHGGFQFAEVKSTFLRRISEAAIDAGADMVISHHPHVLQGVEWYRGHLIAYSLGNLVFDQDFLATFPSAILRVVVAGDEVVEARFLPVMIDDYRPVAVTGEVAERIVRLLDARSAAPAESERIEALQVGGVLVETQPPGTERATVRFERNSGVVESERARRSPPMSSSAPPSRRHCRRASCCGPTSSPTVSSTGSTCSDGAGSTTTRRMAIVVRRCTGSPRSRRIAGRSCRARPTIPTTTRSSSSPTPTSRSAHASWPGSASPSTVCTTRRRAPGRCVAELHDLARRPSRARRGARVAVGRVHRRRRRPDQ